MRWLLLILGGLLLGGVVHLATVMMVPHTAAQDAYARLSSTTPVNMIAQIPMPQPDNAPLTFMDPAFAMAVCRYDLAQGSLKFSVPVSQAYTSVTFYTRYDVA
jgi:uncharacterized membrane protein